VLPREDIGSTLPLGSLLALTGLIFLTGVIGPEWVWELGWAQQAAITAEFLIPVATLFTTLYGGWASAKAYGGFGARGRHMGAYVLVYLNALSIVAFLFILVAYVVVQGVPGLLTGVDIGLGTGPETTILGVSVTLPVYVPFVMNGVALMNDFQGVLPAIVGTFWLVIGAVLLAVPLGVGAAVFLTEYAERGRFTQVVEVATNGLWSTPSIVFGLFGFAFLIPRFGNGKSLLSGMITLGFMLLPLVVITSREAMLSVPDEYRDASAALGVSKWQTIRSVVLPAALPGVVTGVILGVGRIAGETAPILLTMAGGTFIPGSQTVDVLGSFQFTSAPPFVANPALLEATSALPYQLFALITAGVGLGSNVSDPNAFRWGTALVLLMVVLSFYAIGIATRYYFRRRLKHT
jgi:phosphate transport system permease protein